MLFVFYLQLILLGVVLLVGVLIFKNIIMTQEKANEIFKTEIGIQLDVIYVTSDDKVFIRYNEALLHTINLLNGDPENFVDTTITEWYNEN
jgi:hypothetical protein